MKYPRLLSFIIFVALCACKDEQTQHSNNDMTFIQKVKLDYISPDVNFFVDLKKLLPEHGNEKISVKLDKNSSSSCSIESIQNSGFTAIAKKGAACFYEYSISDLFEIKHIGKGAFAGVDDSSVHDLLPVVTKSTKPGSQLDINLLKELGIELIENYKILDAKIIWNNNDGVVLEVVSNDELRFTSTDIRRTYQVLYTLHNDLTSDVRYGLIYISVDDQKNSPPKASNYIFTDVKQGILMSIDLEDMGIIDDNDGDDIQIVNLLDTHGYANFPEHIPPSEVFSNTKISFLPEKRGDYDVYYVVSDHKGGLASGLLRFEVDGSIDGLRDINLLENTTLYDYPRNVSEAITDGENVFSEQYIPSDGDGLIGTSYPLYQFVEANMVCSLRGMRLASFSEMQDLYNAYLPETIYSQKEDNGILQGTGGWPIGASYITTTSDVEEMTFIDMKTGKELTETKGNNGLVACVSKFASEIRIAERFVSFRGERQLHITGWGYSGGKLVPADITPEVDSWAVENIDGEAEISDSGTIYPLKKGAINVTAKAGKLETTKRLLIVDNLITHNINRCWDDINENEVIDESDFYDNDCYLKTEKDGNVLETEIDPTFELMFDNGSLPYSPSFKYSDYMGIDMDAVNHDDATEYSNSIFDISKITISGVRDGTGLKRMPLGDLTANNNGVQPFSGKGMGAGRVFYNWSYADINYSPVTLGTNNQPTYTLVEEPRQTIEIPLVFRDSTLPKDRLFDASNIKQPVLIPAFAVNLKSLMKANTCDVAKIKVGVEFASAGDTDWMPTPLIKTSDGLSLRNVFTLTLNKNKIRSVDFESFPGTSRYKAIQSVSDRTINGTNLDVQFEPNNSTGWIEVSAPFVVATEYIDDLAKERGTGKYRNMLQFNMRYSVEMQLTDNPCTPSDLAPETGEFVIETPFDEMAIFSLPIENYEDHIDFESLD